MAIFGAMGGTATVKTVKIAELKNRLSYYLRAVQRGESILVCDRDRVIARIDRVEAHAPVSESEGEWVDRLERRGVIRRGTGKLPRRADHRGARNRVRSCSTDRVACFRRARTIFQNAGSVWRTTASQSAPSTPTSTAAGLPRRVTTTRSSWASSTHCLTFF